MSADVNCWKCGKGVELPEKKIGFRAICEHCYAWLHCCCNCRYYRPGLPNDCAIPGTDHIADSEAANFCDEYALLEQSGSEIKCNPNDVARRLFGEDGDDGDPKVRFDDLFKD